MLLRPALVALLCSAVAVQAQYEFNYKDFQAWMASGEGTALYGNESLRELSVKVLSRTAQFAEAAVLDPTILADVIKFFEGELIADESSAARALQSSELKTRAHYEKHVQNMLNTHFQALATETSSTWKPTSADPYPFFGFMPNYEASVIPNGPAVTFSAPCFKENTAVAKIASQDENGLVLDVEITTSSPTSLLCSDTYWLATLSGMSFKTFFFHGTNKFQYKVSKSASEDLVWDALNRGIRIMRFVHTPTQLVTDLLETVNLFLEPMTNEFPNADAQARNLYFVNNYANLKPQMTSRTVRDVLIDEDTIQSGDFLGIIRLDGLDPMLAWAMGSTTGHTAICIRDPEDNALYVMESTTNGSYWPTNGIQKTPFNTWMAQARAAGYNLVHAPLSPKYAQLFNITAAMEYFNSVEGLDYGYYNMLWAWVDTVEDNYPCIAPDFKTCMKYDHVELIYGWLDQISHQAADMLFGQAFNHRLGTWGLDAAAVLRKSVESGIPHGVLPTIVEEDTWRYNMTKNGVYVMGESHMCDALVCKMWRAGGLFAEIDNDFNCNEFTNWDAYVLNIFDSDKLLNNRPQQCIDADPTNQLCQLTGLYTINLNNFNTKTMYPHMAERCASQTPYFIKAPDC